MAIPVSRSKVVIPFLLVTIVVDIITVGRGWPYIYTFFANHISNSGLTEPLFHAQAILYAVPNNEQGTKYRGLTYSARQNCP